MLSNQEIKEIYETYHTPKHVILHCIKVAAVGVYLAKKLQANTELVRSSGLLHDALRVCDFKNFNPDILQKNFNATDSDIKAWQKIREKFKNQTHSEAIHKILTKQNEPQIAEIILTHDYSKILDPAQAPKNIEQKIIYYADKRVTHDKIVTLKERIKEGIERYYPDCQPPQHITDSAKKCLQLESELMKKANIHESDISAKSVAAITTRLLQEFV